ncbi:MAG: hypothetical protein JOZ01_00240 [Candidatus Eremiobacteraeota bacterium]|nr:hypothetical protein [Candidatus Eremiobacteraeota bacterium]
MLTFAARLLNACAVLIALASCSGASGNSAYGSGDPNLAVANPGGGPIDPFLTNGDAVVHALDAIAARSGRPLRVTSMTADAMNGLTVEVQEPNNHINVDAYKVGVDGTLSGPVPVKLMSLNGGPITVADVDSRVFDPKSVGFERLTATARDAIAKSKFSDARVSEWDFDGVTPDARRYIFLESARARPAAIVDAHLRILEMRF